MHEAVLKNVFRDDRRACSLRGKRHVLRLHVGGKAGIFFRIHVGGLERLIAHDPYRVGFHGSFDAGLRELLQDTGKVRGIASGHVDVSAGEGSGDDEGSGFDAVGDDAVPRAVQLGDALHADGGRAGALNLRPHGVEQRGEVGDFRFAGAVLHDRLAIRKRGGHQQVFGAGDGNFVEDNFSATKTAAFQGINDGLDVAMLLRDLRAQTLQSLDVEIDGAGANGASPGQGNTGAATTGNQRPQHERGGAHGLDQFIRRFGSGECARANRCPMMGASIAEFDFRTHGGKQLARGLDIAHLRDVFENHRFVGEQGGRHARECGVLRATDSDGAEQRVTAADYELIHSLGSRTIEAPLSF